MTKNDIRPTVARIGFVIFDTRGADSRAIDLVGAGWSDAAAVQREWEALPKLKGGNKGDF